MFFAYAFNYFRQFSKSVEAQSSFLLSTKDPSEKHKSIADKQLGKLIEAEEAATGSVEWCFFYRSTFNKFSHIALILYILIRNNWLGFLVRWLN